MHVEQYLQSVAGLTEVHWRELGKARGLGATIQVELGSRSVCRQRICFGAVSPSRHVAGGVCGTSVVVGNCNTATGHVSSHSFISVTFTLMKTMNSFIHSTRCN